MCVWCGEGQQGPQKGYSIISPFYTAGRGEVEGNPLLSLQMTTWDSWRPVAKERILWTDGRFSMLRNYKKECSFSSKESVAKTLYPGEFSAGPVAKTPCSQFRGPGQGPRSHMTHLKSSCAAAKDTACHNEEPRSHSQINIYFLKDHYPHS